ncbi:alpha-tocopherol transfer protein-like [Trichonephila clavipes]|nr:alpha-tocopherol transfer protein-like [Trichonephila clavipes]
MEFESHVTFRLMSAISSNLFPLKGSLSRGNRKKSVGSRSGLNEDKHTKNLSFDEDFLLQFLRVRKYNITKAFSQLKSYAMLRKRIPDSFSNFQFETTVSTVKDRIISWLPWRCPEGCAIILIELDNWDPETFPVEEVKRAFVVFLLQALREPMTQVNGIKAIIDVKSNPIRHLKHATPNNLYLIYHGIQECCPMRYKQVHIVNDSITFRAAWYIIKRFLSEKIVRRVHFHKTPETLFNYFPRAVLPKHYGGNLESYEMTDWLKRVMSPERLATIGGAELNKTH